MKKTILALIAFLYSIFCVGQNQSLIDSLHAALRTATGEQQFELLTDVGFEYRISTPDSTIYYCTKAYELGVKLHVAKGLSRPVSFLGIASAYQGNQIAALHYHQQSIDIAIGQKDSVQLAFGYNNLGRLFFEQGDLVRAYSNFIESQKLFEIVKNKSGLAYVYRSFSDLFKLQKEYTKALDMARKAYQLRSEIGEPRSILSSLLELGLVYQDMQDPLNALISFREAETIANRIRDKASLAEIQLGVAQVFINTDSLGLAKQEIAKATKNLSRASNPYLFTQVQFLNGKIAYQEKKPAVAIVLLRQVISDSNENSNRVQAMDAHLYLSRIYKAQGDLQQASVHTNQYLLLKESLSNVDLIRQIDRLNFQLTLEKAEKENELLKQDQQIQETLLARQRYIIGFAVILIVLFIVILIIRYRTSRLKKKIYLQLQHKKNQIEAQKKAIEEQHASLLETMQRLESTRDQLIQTEKMAFLGRLTSGIAHEINTPLGAIKASAENVKAAIQHIVPKLQELSDYIPQEKLPVLFEMIYHVFSQEQERDPRVRRALKKTFIADFNLQGIENPELLTDYMVNMGIRDYKPWEPLLRIPHADKIFRIIDQALSIKDQNSNVSLAVSKASKILFALKKYSHQGQEESEAVVVDLSDNIETVLAIYASNLKDVEVIRNYDSEDKVLGYPDELNQVWTNLIHNSLQAMEGSGKLVINILSHTDAEVNVEIIDTGKGISLNDQKKIFEPFFTTKRSGEGTGLGLSIVKKIIEKHGGRIEYESELMKGTTFRVYIPKQNQ